MKKHLPIAAVAATALVLAGCAAGTEDGPSASPSPSGDPSVSPGAPEMTDFGTADDVAMLDAITWDEDDAGVPTLTVETPSTVASTATRIVEAGEGTAVEPGNVVVVNYTITSGTDGSQLYSTYDADTPEAILVSENSLDPVLFNALTGLTEGGDMIFATMDQTASLDQTDPDAPSPAMFMAMTVSEVIEPLDQAEGAAVEPEAGLPGITLDEESGAPALDIGEAEMPTELVVQPLIEGEGEVLEIGDTVVAHYTGWVWDGEKFDSSWDRGEPASFAFAEGQLIQGWTQGLAGKTVGSQVLLVIPPELGYGEQEQAAIPAGSTLVFVVDILAVA